MRTTALLLTSLFLASNLPAGVVPRPAPELMIQRYQQPPITLAEFKGKIVALAFIHTTCSHCQDLTRLLNVIQKDYAARNVQVVAVAFEEGVTNNYLPYVKSLQPAFPTGITNDKEVKRFVGWNDKTDGILMIPYMLFIDAKGVIRGDFNGKDGFFGEADKHIRAQLDKMVKLGAGAAKTPPVKKKPGA